MVEPKYIDESIEESQYRNDKKEFLPHGKELSNIQVF
jgi:hypothetical protein